MEKPRKKMMIWRYPPILANLHMAIKVYPEARMRNIEPSVFHGFCVYGKTLKPQMDWHRNHWAVETIPPHLCQRQTLCSLPRDRSILNVMNWDLSTKNGGTKIKCNIIIFRIIYVPIQMWISLNITERWYVFKHNISIFRAVEVISGQTLY